MNTLITSWVVVVESESSKAKVRGTGKTLRDDVITNHATRAKFRDIPMVRSAECQRYVNGFLLDVSDFWHLPDTLNDGVGEMTGVAIEVTIVGCG